MSEKAQAVRKRRLELLNMTARTVAYKIFDWLLDLMDADTRNGFNGPLKLFLYQKERCLRVYGDHQKTFDLTNYLEHINRMDIMKNLKSIIEKEEGFTVSLELKEVMHSPNTIVFEVSIH